MKAVIYDWRNSPDVLVFRDVEKPLPTNDEVLVKIYAVSINSADYRSMKLWACTWESHYRGCISSGGRSDHIIRIVKIV